MNRHVFNTFPRIDLSGDLVLRELNHTDAQAFAHLLQHPQVMPFIPEDLVPKTIAESVGALRQLQNLFSSGKSIYWGLADADDQLIGSVGFEMWNQFHNRLELAFELHPDYWGRGIMTEAVRTVCDFALEKMRAIRIEAFSLPHNHASHRVLIKAGFTHEATLKRYRHFNNQFYDIEIFARIQPDTST